MKVNWDVVLADSWENGLIPFSLLGGFIVYMTVQLGGCVDHVSDKVAGALQGDGRESSVTTPDTNNSQSGMWVSCVSVKPGGTLTSVVDEHEPDQPLEVRRNDVVLFEDARRWYTGPVVHIGELAVPGDLLSRFHNTHRCPDNPENWSY